MLLAAAERVALTASFDDQFAELFGLAYRVAYRIVGSREDASEIAQETMARAERRWPRLADRPHGWVARVASNQAIGYWRRARRRQTTLLADPGNGDRHTTPPAIDQATERWERVDLVRALQALPRRQREVVILRYLADRAEAEVAAVLGCSAGSVKTHATRGLAALRATLGDPPSHGD
jgi:RNA polymerase sigma factor (sigma-70 family)